MKEFVPYYVFLIFLVICLGCSFKDKKDITITEAFHKILYESRAKLNKIWVDKHGEFYSKSVKS